MKRLSLLSFLMILVLASPCFAEEERDVKSATGLPLPRFASIRSEEVNMRTGPGTRYPIDWVFRKPGMPVEIVAEYEMWRRIKDWEGAEGWVHKIVLAGKRTAIVTGGERDLLKSDSPSAAVVAHLKPGAIGLVLSCEKEWCKMKFESIKGYLLKSEIWGVYPDEVF